MHLTIFMIKQTGFQIPKCNPKQSFPAEKQKTFLSSRVNRIKVNLDSGKPSLEFPKITSSQKSTQSELDLESTRM